MERILYVSNVIKLFFWGTPLLSLAFQAASGVIEVLVRTGGFSTRVLLHRLMETFQWLLQVTHSLSAVQPHGEGHASTIRIRLLHASVRQRIMKLVQSRPDYFNVEKYGVPVNTLDSIHSITVFSCNPMWLQLPKMGILPKQQEIDDYIAVFRYLAYLLAVPTEYVETSEKAKATMESLYLHELEPTETSKVVGYNFVKCLEDLPPANISAQFIEAGGRWFNGNDLCDAIDIGRPGWYHYVLMIGFTFVVMTLAYLQRLIPRLDEFMIIVCPPCSFIPLWNQSNTDPSTLMYSISETFCTTASSKVRPDSGNRRCLTSNMSRSWARARKEKTCHRSSKRTAHPSRD